MLQPPRGPIVKPLLLIVGLLLLVGLALLMSSRERSTTTTIPPTSETPSIAGQTVIGELACLPHKNTDSPQPEICIYGLKTNSGDYYALDATFYPDPIADLPMGVSYAVSGSVTPIADVKNDQLTPYAVIGIIHVSDIAQTQ